MLDEEHIFLGMSVKSRTKIGLVIEVGKEIMDINLWLFWWIVSRKIS